MFSSVIKKTVNYWISKKIISDSDRDIYEYGLELVLFSLINILAIITTAIFINRLFESIILIASVIPMQCFGGGYHATTHLRCFLIMYIGWWIAMLLIPYITPLSTIVVASISIIPIFILAPVSHKNVSLSYNQRKKMKKFVRIAAICVAILSVMASRLLHHNTHIGIALAIGIGAVAISMIAARFKTISCQTVT